MKYLVLALLLTSSTSQAFELMKCTSLKNGTIWASFGKILRSGENVPAHFPTELVVFGHDSSARLVFDKLNDALKIDLVVDASRIHLQFDVPKGPGKQSHLLQVLRYDPRVPNGFVGNWTASEEGKKDVIDMVACTVN